MIVKILGNKGGGSASAVIDYMLGKDKDREGALLLSGDPDLTARIADNLEFQNRYTVGVLSFEEPNISEKQKQQIMADFEKTLLAGLERDQYDITWIEHRDKGRLELNFIIPNVELSTGKRLQPYYDKVDRPLVENWKQKTNFEHGLSDPHAPEKAQAIKTLNSQNLPPSVKEIKEQIGLAIADQIGKGIIQDRKDVIQTLEGAGFEITRQTDRSISIKNPDGKRNIRLEGTIYENRQFDSKFAEEHHRARADYQGTSRERYATALGKLQSLVESKQQANRERFKSQSKPDSTRTVEDQKRTTFEYIYRVSAGYPDSVISSLDRGKSMAWQDDHSQKPRTFRIEDADRKNKIGKISTVFDNAFNRDDELNSLMQSESLFSSLPSKSNTKKLVQQPTQLEQDYAKRLYESLQRIIELIREATERITSRKSVSERADRILEQSDSNIERTEQRIERSQRTIEQSESNIKQSEQQIEGIKQSEMTKQAQNKRDNGGLSR